MSWNEPGQGGRDPWNRDNHSGGGKGPQWDDLFNQLKKKLPKNLGKGGGGIATVIVVLLVVWLVLSSYTIIGPRETGVVLQFGAYSRSLPSGFHLKLPSPLEKVYKVKTSKIRSVSNSVKMLTNDESIVAIDFNVQWQVNDARKYLFSMRDPAATISHAAESALRAVVGASPMSTVLSGQGAELVTATRQRLQHILDDYNAGLRITQVSFENVQPPNQVHKAFDDVNKAREDKQRFKNEANAYASHVIPVARGKAARITAQAEAYRLVRVAEAQGDIEKFDQVLKQYELAPDVTRTRLWLESMENILSKHPKIVDGTSGRNVFYLNMDSKTKTSKGNKAKTVPAIGNALGSGATVPEAGAGQGGAQ